VFVVEKGRVAGEQSSRNWGWIRQLGRDEAELPIMMEASRLWEQIDGETGNRTGFRRTGIMYLASTDKEMEERAKWLDVARRHQLDVRAIDGDEVAGPDRHRGRRQAMGRCGLVAHRCPRRAVGCGARGGSAGAQRRCGHSRELRDPDLRNQAGKLSGVHTEHGFIAASQVVVAGGAWTSLLLRNMGIALPQLSVRSTVMRTAPMPEVYDGAALDEELALRRREDGSYTVSALDAHDLLIGPDSFRHLRTWLPTGGKGSGPDPLPAGCAEELPRCLGHGAALGRGRRDPVRTLPGARSPNPMRAALLCSNGALRRGSPRSGSPRSPMPGPA
jgi:glycine/D-amino acid oxidase-like deaminating enzyme